MQKFYEIKKTMYIPPDPKTLWKDLKVDDFEGYEYPDEAYDHIALKDIEKTLIAASCRGRSHAHVGKPRDDNYKFACNLESGWNICAVADGAGSGRFSRKGSDLACSTAIDTCKALFEKEDLAPQISNDIRRLYDFRANVSSHPSNRSSEEELKFRNELILDKLFHRMVYDAYNKIHNEYKLKKQEPKYDKLELSAYHSTLLLLAFKKFDFGYFFGSYWIGDGAMLIYNVEGKGQVEILGVPDSGDYAGQTRFLTMISEIEAEKIKKRTRFTFARSFESIIMATDGITDAFFPSEESTLSGENWIEFWTKTLREGEYGCPGLFDPSVAPGEQAKALRGWLDFWSKGNHDDRTILIIK
jgi:serine/threonine protein phosphatase PrpC